MAIIIEQRTRADVNSTWSVWSNVDVDTVTDGTFTDTDTVEYRVIDENLVDIEDVTSNRSVDANYVVTGDGILDELMETVNMHIKAQYDASRIDGNDVANMYVGIMPAVLAESFKFALQRKTNSQQLRVLEAQEALYQRQKDAFDDNKYQKLFESQLNYNGMVFQDAADPDVLDVALEQRVNDVFNKITGTDPNLSTVPEV
jgi:hypothetical protein